MSTNITVRDIDPAKKSWLRREAKRTGVSMEELVRRLIHEERMRTEAPVKASEAFRPHFGEHHGVEFLPLVRYGYEPLSFSGRGWPEVFEI